MGTESWVEDESHRTINGVRWVARECDDCDELPSPACELFGTSDCSFKDPPPCARVDRKDGRPVRWYRADSPALAFFDKKKEETPPICSISDIATDGVRAWLRMIYQDRDRQAVEALRDSQATSLDDRVQAALDVILNLRASESSETPTPEDDVEIIIDPTPEQVPEDGLWGCWWNDNRSSSGGEKIFRSDIRNPTWDHYAILVRGHLEPKELAFRVRKMLAEKEGK